MYWNINVQYSLLCDSCKEESVLPCVGTMENSTETQSPVKMKFTDGGRFSMCHGEDYRDTVERSQEEDATKQMRGVTRTPSGGEVRMAQPL